MRARLVAQPSALLASSEGWRVALKVLNTRTTPLVADAELCGAASRATTVRRLHRPEAAVAAAVVGGQIAPQPAWVTGPRHGVPWATITQTVPRRLHSTQTLSSAIAGGGRAGTRVDHLEQLVLVIGQPRSSKSTGTWSAIGVEVASVQMYSGRA